MSGQIATKLQGRPEPAGDYYSERAWGKAQQAYEGTVGRDVTVVLRDAISDLSKLEAT